MCCWWLWCPLARELVVILGITHAIPLKLCDELLYSSIFYYIFVSRMNSIVMLSMRSNFTYGSYLVNHIFPLSIYKVF